MPPEAINPWLNVIVVAMFCASAATLVALLKNSRQGPLLSYEPRRPVPWGAAAPVLITLFVLSRIYTVVAGEGIPQVEDFGEPDEMLRLIAGGVIAQFLLVAAFFAAIALMSSATWEDVGFPRSIDQLLRDVKLGVVAWLAAIIPVYGLQAGLTSWGGEPSSHPLIQVVLENPNTLTLAVAFLSAAILAPLGEEIAFRLLLQGWLEKLEDVSLGWRRVPEPAAPTAADATTETLPVDAAPAVLPIEPSTEPSEPAEPPTIGLFGLRYGRFPILVSSALFAVAHLGHGPDPIPLFVLAMILGYLYQRTHRIVPCIVTHLLINATSLTLLWLAIAFGSDKVP